MFLMVVGVVEGILECSDRGTVSGDTFSEC